MTAKTSQKLADVLRAAKFEALATRAEQDEFHDFLSPHALPEMILAHELAQIMTNSKDAREVIAATSIRNRLIYGEFDASFEESEEWANSPEGQDAFGKIARGE